MRLRFGLVGLGAWGKRVAHTLATECDHATLAAVATQSGVPEGAGRLPYPVPIFKGAETMLEQVQLDALYIASPFRRHAEHMALAVRCDLPFIVEKPVTTSSELHTRFSMTKVPWMVNHVHLFHPAVETLHDAILGLNSRDEVTELHLEHGSRGPCRDDCSPLYDYAPHGIALAFYFATRGMLLPPPALLTVTNSHGMEAPGGLLQNYNIGFHAGHVKVRLVVGNDFERKVFRLTVKTFRGCRYTWDGETLLRVQRKNAQVSTVLYPNKSALANAVDRFVLASQSPLASDIRMGVHLPLAVMNTLECVRDELPREPAGEVAGAEG